MGFVLDLRGGRRDAKKFAPEASEIEPIAGNATSTTGRDAPASLPASTRPIASTTSSPSQRRKIAHTIRESASSLRY
jgi:hypothetical protein